MREKRRISDGTQKREPTWEAAHDKSGIGVQAGGRFWRRNRRGCAPTGNIDLWGFEDIDQTFVQLVNNVRFSSFSFPQRPFFLLFPFPKRGANLQNATCWNSREATVLYRGLISGYTAPGGGVCQEKPLTERRLPKDIAAEFVLLSWRVPE